VQKSGLVKSPVLDMTLLTCDGLVVRSVLQCKNCRLMSYHIRHTGPRAVYWSFIRCDAL